MITKDFGGLIANGDKTVLIGGSLSEIIMRDNEVIKIYRGNDERGYEKLRQEVTYLRSLPDELRSYYPEIIEVIDSPGLYGYKMPYYGHLRSLSDEVFSDLDIQLVWSKLASIIDFMDKKQYPKINTTMKLDLYIEKIIHERLEQAHKVLTEIKDIGEITKGRHQTNDVTLLPLNHIRAELSSDRFTNKTLRPKELGLFHGNFHMDNMLVNEMSFMLIDPRGETYGSKTYDMCKLFVHMLLRYDEIHAGKFRLVETGKTIDIYLTDQKTGKRYDYIQEQYLKKCISELGNENFTKSLLIVGGAHAVSFASYHARKSNPDYNRVKAYLTGGMLLLSMYLNRQEIDLHKSLFPYTTKDLDTSL